jgi:hypothetical protein
METLICHFIGEDGTVTGGVLSGYPANHEVTHKIQPSIPSRSWHGFPYQHRRTEINIGVLVEGSCDTIDENSDPETG